MNDKRPIRTCIGCGETCERGKLLRLVRDEHGHVAFDPAAARPGRGAWVHAEAACIERALEARRLSRAFRARAQAPEGLHGELVAAARSADRRLGR